MVKEIFLKQKYENENFLGQFLDESNFDVLLTEDADVYKPSAFGEDRDDSNVLLKFRKNVFSKEVQDAAYLGLKDGATASHNRGIAAGAIVGESQKQSPSAKKGRGWVTDFQMDIFNAFMQPSNKTLFDDEGVSEFSYEFFEKKHADNPNKVSSLRGHVWLEDKIKAENFTFNEWAKETFNKPKIQQMEDAKYILEEFISGTNYANPVFSGVAGYYDRYPRIPFCRATAYTMNNKEKFEDSIPFVEGISEWFKKLLPQRWENQKKAIDTIDESYKIGESVYTTLTLNKNFRTAAHRDSGDLPDGFGNLTALSDERGWDGCYLCFPEYRVAVAIKPGDVLLMDVHEIHGNTQIRPREGFETPERISIVAYFRENMFGCSVRKYEDLRMKFVNYNKNNDKHEFWRENWNGVYPAMWESKDWYDYIALNEGEDFLKEHHPEAFKSTVDDFFA